MQSPPTDARLPGMSEQSSFSCRPGDDCDGTLSALRGLLEAVHVFVLSIIPADIPLELCKFCHILLSLDKRLPPTFQMYQSVGQPFKECMDVLDGAETRMCAFLPPKFLHSSKHICQIMSRGDLLSTLLLLSYDICRRYLASSSLISSAIRALNLNGVHSTPPRARNPAIATSGVGALGFHLPLLPRYTSLPNCACLTIKSQT